jgi:hypothetical protein
MAAFADLLAAADSPLLAYLDAYALPADEQPGLDSRQLLPIFAAAAQLVAVASSDRHRPPAGQPAPR